MRRLTRKADPNILLPKGARRAGAHDEVAQTVAAANVRRTIVNRNGMMKPGGRQ
ncbi:hypothetical protein [Paraburkholderia mimosarum]|uniref:hypothetical protein n=1 Tax=Paraburkholderia mimosarum TaxID=312026 RepID=UPI000427CFF6|nr:hypothetical protein [Paraburkholderia mimosarum]